MVSRQDLLFLSFGISTFGFKHTVFSAVFTHVLLTATRIMTIFDEVLAVTISTFVNNQLHYHVLTILHITSTSPLSNILLELFHKLHPEVDPFQMSIAEFSL